MPILDPGGRPGLGARAEFGIPVTRVAKSRCRTATHAVPVARILGAALFVTAAGGPSVDAADQVRSWPTGTGFPTHCAAPVPSRGQVRPQSA